jgi:hypothetical protein
MSRLRLRKFKDTPDTATDTDIRNARVTVRTLTGESKEATAELVETVLHGEVDTFNEIELRRYETRAFADAFKYLDLIGIRLTEP